MSIQQQVVQESAVMQGFGVGDAVRAVTWTAVTAAAYAGFIFAVTGAVPTWPMLAVPIVAKAVGAFLNNRINPMPIADVRQSDRQIMGVSFVSRHLGNAYNLVRNNIIPFALFCAGMVALDGMSAMPEAIMPKFDTWAPAAKGLGKFALLGFAGIVASNYLNKALGLGSREQQQR